MASATAPGRSGGEMVEPGGDLGVGGGVIGGDGVDEAHALGLGGAETFGGEEPAAGLAGADLGDDEGRDGRGRQAQPDFGQAEFRAFDGDRHVGAGDKANATAGDGAMDAGDDGFRAGVDGDEHVRQFHGVGAVLGLRPATGAAHPGDVGAGAEGLAVAGQQDGADSHVAAQRGEGFGERRDQRLVKGVVRRRPVQRDPRDAFCVNVRRQHWVGIVFWGRKASCGVRRAAK